MIREALEYFVRISREADKPFNLEIADPKAKYFLVNGKILRAEIPENPREHRPNSLEDFIAVVLKFGDDPFVFFDEKSVIGILDGYDHRVNWVTFVLVKSDQWEALTSYGRWLSQKDFVRLLRIDLVGCLLPATLLDRVRKLVIENGVAISSEVGRQKESLGRSIQATVTGSGDFPEQVVLSIPIYKTLGEKAGYPLRCSVEIDPMRMEPFRLLPLPDELERVQHLAMTSIRERLLAGLDGVPIFYGRP
jgi:hypothetical protein